jgi:hypothetical protein
MILSWGGLYAGAIIGCAVAIAVANDWFGR